MPLPGFVATFAYLTSGLIIWIVRFLAVYGFTGLYCARPDWPGEIAGISVPVLVVGATTLVALGLDAAIIAHGVARLRPSPARGSENGRFVHHVAVAVAGLGALAIVWETLPLLLIPICR